MLQRVTMRQIAERAGVHSTTVSLALRNHPSLPLETRQRLQDLAKEMGYRPDPMLGALMHYRSLRHPASTPPLIFYMNPWRNKKTWGQELAHYNFYTGAKEKAESLGFLFEHCWLHDPGVSTARWNQIIRTRNVRGVILGSFRHGRGHTRLALEGRSWVKMDSYYIDPQVHMVANNQVQCSQLAVHQARKNGYRRIGLVIWKRSDEATNRGWTCGHLGETAFFPKKDQIPPCIYLNQEEKTFWKWFKSHSPEVILGFRYVLDWILKKKVRVPEDVAFLDLDVIKADGSVAGIFQNHEFVGGVAVEVLAGMIQRNEVGPPAWPLITHVDGRWVDGATLPPRYAPRKT